MNYNISRVISVLGPITNKEIDLINSLRNKHYKFKALECNDGYFWIASGLAKISAAYGNDICNQNNLISTFNSALNYKLHVNQRFMPILVSLGGKGEDAVDIAKLIVSRSQKAGLITANSDSLVEKILIDIDLIKLIGSYPQRDKRFINLKGVLALSIYCEIYAFSLNNSSQILPLLIDIKEIEEKAELIFRDIITHANWRNNLVVLGSGYNSAIEYTWKAILQEAGIASVRWYDIKDYTHGEHQYSIVNEDLIYIIIETDDVKLYSEIFETRFSKITTVYRIKISSNLSTNFWENLIYVSNLASILSHYCGYEGNRPPKDLLRDSWRGWGRL